MAGEVPTPQELKIAQRLDQTPAPAGGVTHLCTRPRRSSTAAGLRKTLVQAQRLLGEAGWTCESGALRNAAGEAFCHHHASFRTAAPRSCWRRTRATWRGWVSNCAYRLSDASLIKKRLDDFDFDMAINILGGSTSPGNELCYDDFGSASADQKAARASLASRTR